MIIYVCNKCNKQFNRKSSYSDHLNKKYPCKPSNSAIVSAPISEQCLKNSSKILQKGGSVDLKSDDYPISNQNIITCEYCDKCFSNNYNKNRHINGRCKVIKNKDTKIEQLETKLKELEELVKKGNCCSGTVKTINSNNSNNTNTINNISTDNSNNTQNIVNINMFGKEDLSHISDETYKQIFKRCKNSVPALIKIKHFSVKKPENSNVYISDLKGQYVNYYNGEQWNIGNSDEILQNMYDKNCGLLMNKYNDLKDKLDDITIRKYDRFIETVDELETESNAKEEIKKILYNEKEKSINNKKNHKIK
jgi:uncharacterized C2H2 Zn-finger protein